MQDTGRDTSSAQPLIFGCNSATAGLPTGKINTRACGPVEILRLTGPPIRYIIRQQFEPGLSSLFPPSCAPGPGRPRSTLHIFEDHMKGSLPLQVSVIVVVLLTALATAQQPTTAAPVVPNVINYSGTLNDLKGKPLSGIQGVTFLLYSSENAITPLWMETQNVTPGKNGQYTATLGVTTAQGLPSDLFISGEARWLATQVAGQPEQARVLLVAVPYALKAADAQTIGGLPPSAFVLATPAKTGNSSAAAGSASTAASAKSSAPPANPAVTGKGVVDYIPMWDTTSDIVDSILFQKSSEIGVNTTSPAALLDVNGKTDVRDTLTLFPKSTDLTLAISGTTFKIDQTGKVTFITGQTFPGTGTITGITTASGSGLSGGGTSGTLSLKIASAGVTNAMLADSKITLNANTAGGLTTPGAMTLGSTYTIGLKPCSTNQVLQYSGTVWNCATAGVGTITGVTAGSDLTGGGTAGTVTLNLDTTKVPLLAAANKFTGNQTVTGTVTATSFSGSGTGLTGVTAANSSELGGLAASAFAQLTAANTFTNVNAIKVNNNSSPALYISNSGSFDGIEVSAPGSSAYGVWVENAGVNGVEVDSAGNDGVIAYGSSEGGYFNGGNTGLYAYTASTGGVGVYGQDNVASVTGQTNCCEVGVWGDSGLGGAWGVLGTVDEGTALIGYNNSDISSVPTLYVQNLNTSGGGTVFQAWGNGANCTIDISANLSCSGSITAVAPVEGGAKKVALNAIHSAENWFEDAGSGQLSNGEAVVNIESLFGETVDTGVDYHVFLTPNGDCKGLYIAQKSAASFVVRELGGGTSSVAFDYRIMAKRKGFENVRLADKTQL